MAMKTDTSLSVAEKPKTNGPVSTPKTSKGRPEEGPKGASFWVPMVAMTKPVSWVM